jgi:hypothetical protein
MSSQVLLTPQVITRESLVKLENNLVAANRVNRKFENKFVKIGASLTVRKPNRFTVASGASLQLQDIAEPSVSITIDKQKHVDFQFTSQDLTLTVEEFNSRYTSPAMATLANQVDFDVLGNWDGVSNYVGVPGVTPATFSSSVQLVGRRQDDNAAVQDGRCLVLNPAAHWAMAGGLITSFVMPTAKDALVKGYLTTIGGYEIYMDQNIQGGNVGQHNTSIGMVVTSAGNGVGTSTSMYGGTPTEVISVGEVFTVNGVFNINPQNRQSTGVLKNFVVTASTAAGANSTWTVNFSPAIVTSGPYQNVTGPMATATTVTWLTGTTAAQIAGTQNLAFTRDAFGLVMVPLEIPGGVDFAARETYKNISMRTIRAYDINNDVFPTRIDILYGDTTYYDELAVRLGG